MSLPDIDDIERKLLDEVFALDATSDELTTAIKNLKNFADVKTLLAPEPTPEPEPSGAKAVLQKHAGDLIKVGGTILTVAAIALFETKGDVIFRPKASKYI